MTKPFKNLKVVELASVLAGPSVGLFFAELGAKVIKIENKTTNGDVTRSWKLETEKNTDNTSAYFFSVNAGKSHLFLDLKNKIDYAKCIKEIKTADIIITNYKKGDDVKLGLHYSAIKKLNQKIIYASINGFGEESERAAYDLILQAESGFMSINGEKKSKPLKMPVALIDILAAHQLKEGILLALLQQAKDGKSKKVSVSLFDSAVASLANQATNWLVAKHLPVQLGSIHPNIAPYGEIFTTKDKAQITFAIGTDKQFISLLTILKLENVIDTKLCGSNQLRVKNREAIFDVLSQSISTQSFKTLYNKCLQADVPIGKIRNIKEVMELPEAKKMIVKGKKAITLKSNSFKIS